MRRPSHGGERPAGPGISADYSGGLPAGKRYFD
jgi:hypothetical protein